ncbi:MAG: response regulator transcription factor [Treponemataceae bacterium]
MIRILIVDDHGIVRKGLIQILAEHPGMLVAGEASSGQEALDLVSTRDFDVAILDIAMPGRGGLDILKTLKAQKPSLKVIMLSMYSEEQYAIRSLRDGASAYITKANATDELVKAIEIVANGKRFITPSIAERLANFIEDDGDLLPHESLSDRELQVLVMIGSGKSVSDIAAELSLSIKTVSTYRARLLEKMSMETNAQLIKYTLQNTLEQ